MYLVLKLKQNMVEHSKVRPINFAKFILMQEKVNEGRTFYKFLDMMHNVKYV